METPTTTPHLTIDLVTDFISRMCARIHSTIPEPSNIYYAQSTQNVPTRSRVPLSTCTHLDYCNSLLWGTSQGNIIASQRVQNAAAGIVVGAGWRDLVVTPLVTCQTSKPLQTRLTPYLSLRPKCIVVPHHVNSMAG